MTDREGGPEGAVVVATWNVHRCVGRDGREDPERTAQVIRELGADVVALQEVDGGLFGASDQFARLADAVDLRLVAAPAILEGDGRYGNALLTRLPVLDVRHVDLSVPGFEPRAALDVRLEDASGPLRIVATHLGLARRERREQVARLVEHLDGSPDERVVLLGDLNEWWPGRGDSLAALQRHLGAAPRPATFPARRPIFSLDRILVDPPGALQDLAVHRSPAARQASDHLPLLARLRFEKG